MAKLEERKRASGCRLRRPVIYIVCEGAKTEVNYFSKFRTRYSNIDIRPIQSKYKSARFIVEHASEIIKQEPYYPKDGDQLWCVFDRNSNTNEELHISEEAASRRGFFIAFSNPAFELWFLLHYVDQRACLANASDVITKLSSVNCIPNYNKSGDYYDTLLPLRQQAIDRALALQDYHKRSGNSLLHRDSNPCTTVSHLVGLLQSRADQH